MASTGAAAPLPPEFDQQLAATISRLFWLEDQSKSDIAEQFNLSRFKVARILDDARKYGIARIEIVQPSEEIELLARQVRDAYGLHDVRLSSVPVSAQGGLRSLGAVAASFINAVLPPDSVLGLGWGATLAEVVSHLEQGGPTDVVQLAGGFAGSDADFNANQLISSASRTLRGTPYMLHAPALVADGRARALLREDETIARTVARYRHLDAMVTGIGVLRSSAASAIYRGGVLSASIHKELRKWNVVGDTCCHFIDEDGTVIMALSDRVTGISVDEIQKTKLRIAVAGGSDKELPIRAALRSGLPNVLITDSDTARSLLSAASSPGSTDSR